MPAKDKTPFLPFGLVIRETRLRRGMSQSMVQFKTGINQETISRIENGHIQNPRVQTILILAEVFGVKMDHFFRGKP